MSVPQNILDDLTALDGAVTTQQQGQATLVTAQSNLATAQTAVADATTADQANQVNTQTAEAKLDADVAAWVAGSPTPPVSAAQKHPLLKASLKRLGR